MPLTIGAFDRMKAAVLSLPMSGKTLIGAAKGARLYNGVRQQYQTPAAAYDNLLQQKLGRQHAVADYASFRSLADCYDPTDATAQQQQMEGKTVTRTLNKLSLEDWNRLLKPGALLDANIKDLFEMFAGQMTVLFISHHADPARLKRIEIVYEGYDTPQVVSMHW